MKYWTMNRKVPGSSLSSNRAFFSLPFKVFVVKKNSCMYAFFLPLPRDLHVACKIIVIMVSGFTLWARVGRESATLSIYQHSWMIKEAPSLKVKGLLYSCLLIAHTMTSGSRIRNKNIRTALPLKPTSKWEVTRQYTRKATSRRRVARTASRGWVPCGLREARLRRRGTWWIALCVCVCV